MQELIEKLKDKVGITDAQAQQVLEAVKDFVKEKFPMLEGAVENIFTTTASNAEDFLDSAKSKLGGLF